MPAHAPKRGFALPLAVTVLGFAAIGVAEDIPTRHSIEHDLTARSATALRRADLNGATVSFVGRDGTVRVPTVNDADRALAIVRNVNGVRVAKVIVALGSGTMSPVVTPSAVPTVSVTVSPPPTAPAPPAGPSASPSPASPSPAVPSPAPLPSPSASATPPAAPPPSTVTRQQTQSQLGALKRVTFRTNSSTLTAADRVIVKQMAAILAAAPDVHIQIQGDTDSAGPAAYNLTLSRNRAHAVYAALVADGIDASRLTVIGYGETRPKVPNTSEHNRAINRRVDMVVTER